MTKTCELPVLLVLHNIMCKYGKLYCYPAQRTILGFLARFQGIKRCSRTLCRWMRHLEDRGFIKRMRRIKKDPAKGMMFKSTLYKITYKGYKFLNRCGVDCYEKIAEMAKKKEKPKHNKEIKEPQPVSHGKAVLRKEMRRIWDIAKLGTKSVLSLFV